MKGVSGPMGDPGEAGLSSPLIIKGQKGDKGMKGICLEGPPPTTVSYHQNIHFFNIHYFYEPLLKK